VDVNVYFVLDADEESIISLRDTLLALPDVAHIAYVSREQALADFRARHANDQLTLQALEELDDNPLPASLNITAKQTSQYANIALFLESKTLLSADGTPLVESINYAQNKDAIERLTSVISTTERASLIIAIVLMVLSVLISFNTIRLAIYTSREEISVMRLVGASNTYVRSPFMVEGMLAGLSAGLIAMLLFYPLTLWLGPSTESFFGDLNIFTYYMGNFGQIFLIVVGAGVLLGAFSSLLAVRRYLKV
jgi:cell division transport system permease protein